MLASKSQTVRNLLRFSFPSRLLLKREKHIVPGFGLSGHYFLSFLKANGISVKDADFKFAVKTAKTWPNGLDTLIAEKVDDLTLELENSQRHVRATARLLS